MNHDEHVTQEKQFRQQVYQNFNKRADTLMDLLDALCSNTSAQTVVELSLNPFFRREYSSLFTALEEWKPDEATKSLAQLAAPFLPKPEQRPFYLLGADVTPQPRLHAKTLEDRSYVHQPNTVKSNKPITIGHNFSSVVMLPEEEEAHGPVWVIPLNVRRVASQEDKEIVGAEQVAALLTDKELPFHERLCVEVEDSGYSKPVFLAHNRNQPNLVTITRARNTRIFYRQPASDSDHPDVGHPTWYGEPFNLSDESTWQPPDNTETTTMTSLSGKTYRVEIEAWKNLLMKGERKPVVLPMQQYPFTLVRIRMFNEQGELAFQRPMWLIVMGERRHELTLLDIFSAYQRRYDLEHFFRFGKQRLLLDRYQTPETDHEEKWWHLVHLAYLQLWVFRGVAEAVPRPWECAPPAGAQHKLSTTHVQRDFSRIIRQFGTPATSPKRRGNSPGRRKGTIFPRRPRPDVVYKGKKAT